MVLWQPAIDQKDRCSLNQLIKAGLKQTRTSTKQWMTLENLAHGCDLRMLPWLTSDPRPWRAALLPLTADLLDLWRGANRSFNLSPWGRPTYPFFGNPSFPPTHSVSSFLIWNKQSHRRLAQFLTSGQVPSLPYSSPSSPPSLLHRLQYLQLFSFIHSLGILCYSLKNLCR